MIKSTVKIRDSIATRLMRIVFVFYVIFAVIITAIHMVIEYNYQKVDVNDSLIEFQPSIQSTIAMNIWHMDDISLSETMQSIVKIPTIVGITITDENDALIAAQGVIADVDVYGLVDLQIDFLGIGKQKLKSLSAKRYRLDVFKHEFPIFYDHGRDKRELGKVSLYSSSSVIFKRVKVEFILLVINAILKIIALWFFFLYISNKLLRKPLSLIADTAEKVNINNLADVNISLNSSKKDELKVIEESFNGMIKKLSDSLTKQREAQEQIVEQKNRFEALVDNIPGVTYRCKYDKENTMLFVSDEISRLSGYSDEEFLNGVRTYNSIIYIEDTALVERTIQKSLHKKSNFDIEYRITKADGALCWVNERGKCILGTNDNVKYIDGVIVDINERKCAEFEVRKLKKYLANIIDSMPSSLVGVDADMKVTQWNKTIADATGVSEKNALGQEFHKLLPHLEAEIDKISESIKTRTILANETRKNTSGDTTKFEDVTIYPLIANGVQGAVIRIDDVTDKVHIEEILIQSEKMLSVGGLAAGFAHEVNNPLAGMMQTIHVMSNRLVEKPDMPANVKAANEVGTTTEIIAKYMQLREIPRMIDTIISAGNRAASIISNMLSFARKGNSEKIQENLNQLITNTIELAVTDYNIKGHYDFKKIKIIKDFLKEELYVCCDKSQIQQVLLNLMRNSAQAMHEAVINSPSITLRTSYDSNSEMVLIEIEDNGPGMDDETVKRIFEPFFTTKSVGVGTGLGLSVSYFIITENHSGDMYVTSEPGRGTKFTIKLPSQCSLDKKPASRQKS